MTFSVNLANRSTIIGESHRDFAFNFEAYIRFYALTTGDIQKDSKPSIPKTTQALRFKAQGLIQHPNCVDA
jgi:hypothetical protein